jgi:hypothetical protein
MIESVEYQERLALIATRAALIEQVFVLDNEPLIFVN